MWWWITAQAILVGRIWKTNITSGAEKTCLIPSVPGLGSLQLVPVLDLGVSTWTGAMGAGAGMVQPGGRSARDVRTGRPASRSSPPGKPGSPTEGEGHPYGALWSWRERDCRKRRGWSQPLCLGNDGQLSWLHLWISAIFTSGQPKAPPPFLLRSPLMAAAVVQRGFGAHHRWP